MNGFRESEETLMDRQVERDFPSHQYHIYFDDGVEEDDFIEVSRSGGDEVEEFPAQDESLLEVTSSEAQRHLVGEPSEDLHVDPDATITQDTFSQVNPAVNDHPQDAPTTSNLPGPAQVEPVPKEPVLQKKPSLERILEQPDEQAVAVLTEHYPSILPLYTRMRELEQRIGTVEQADMDNEDGDVEQLEELRAELNKAVEAEKKITPRRRGRPKRSSNPQAAATSSGSAHTPPGPQKHKLEGILEKPETEAVTVLIKHYRTILPLYRRVKRLEQQNKAEELEELEELRAKLKEAIDAELKRGPRGRGRPRRLSGSPPRQRRRSCRKDAPTTSGAQDVPPSDAPLQNPSTSSEDVPDYVNLLDLTDEEFNRRFPPAKELFASVYQQLDRMLESDEDDSNSTTSSEYRRRNEKRQKRTMKTFDDFCARFQERMTKQFEDLRMEFRAEFQKTFLNSNFDDEEDLEDDTMDIEEKAPEEAGDSGDVGNPEVEQDDVQDALRQEVEDVPSSEAPLQNATPTSEDVASKFSKNP